MSTTSFALARSRRTPLASAVAALFALSAPAAYATTFVTNCNDAGAGSLRAAVITAAEGDTVDASGLTAASPGCGLSKITLKTGDIVINRNTLTIKGPGPANLTVTAKYDPGMGGATHQYQNRIFTHNGTGTLHIEDMTVNKGYQVTTGTTAALGGCVYSKAGVALKNVNMTFCTAKSATGASKGGAIYSKGQTYTMMSNLTFNAATSVSNAGYGGAVAANGSFIAKYSSFTLNTATNAANTNGISGGIDTRGTLALIRNTTISANHSDGNIGGLTVVNGGASATLINSTISGNTAPNGLVGGVYLGGDDIALYNSTIVYNTSKLASINLGPGVTIVGMGSPKTLKLESNLIANNSYGASNIQNDLTVIGSPTTTGHNNLIRTPSGSVPGDTIANKCPLLKPLKDNGGLTQTHSLYGHSPALDVGNTTGSGSFDQRGQASINGTIDYPRVSGPPGVTAVADIGAFEVNQSEEIFDSAFEGCP